MSKPLSLFLGLVTATTIPLAFAWECIYSGSGYYYCDADGSTYSSYSDCEEECYGLSVGAIAGIVVVIIVLLAIVGIIICVCIRNRARGSTTSGTAAMHYPTMMQPSTMQPENTPALVVVEAEPIESCPISYGQSANMYASEPDQREEIMVEEVTHPDGRCIKTTTKTVVNQDGSKTVTKTVEERGV